jgi:hypothetical protein
MSVYVYGEWVGEENVRECMWGEFKSTFVVVKTTKMICMSLIPFKT